MLLGIVANPPRDGGVSEREALDSIQQMAAESKRLMDSQPRRTQYDVLIHENLRRIEAYARVLLKQVRAGYHVNGRGIKTSDHVQAIIYKHCDDDNYYVHGFGDADLDLKVRGEQLRIDGLVEDTEVQMFAQPDGSVRIVGRNGQRLWEDIEV